MLISNCKFFLTLTPTITPTIGLKCLVLKALYHCVISFFITFKFGRYGYLENSFWQNLSLIMLIAVMLIKKKHVLALLVTGFTNR